MIVFDTPRPVNFRRFKMTSHCASTLPGAMGTTELLAFGYVIGLRSGWLQNEGTPTEHFDLFDGKIEAARRTSATEITPREFIAQVVRPKREAGS